jgi:hypothetical protein
LERALTLEEIGTVQMPDSFLVAGAAFGSSGATIVWASNSSAMLYFDRERGTRELHTRRVTRPVAVAFNSDSRRLQVVDAFTHSILTTDLEGRVIDAYILPRVRLITSAHPLRGTWFLIARDDLDRELTLRVTLQPKPAIDTLEVLEGVAAYLRRLSGDDDIALISQVRFPFQLRLISASERMSANVQTQNPAVIAAAQNADDSSRWIAMPYLIIDSLLLHTRSDLTSDQRVPALLRRDGTIVRARAQSTPMAFIAASSSLRQVLAARRLNHLELVWYRWRWVDTTTKREN